MTLIFMEVITISRLIKSRHRFSYINAQTISESKLFAIKLKIFYENKISLHEVQDAQLSQRDRAAGCITVLAKSGMTGTDNYG